MLRTLLGIGIALLLAGGTGETRDCVRFDLNHDGVVTLGTVEEPAGDMALLLAQFGTYRGQPHESEPRFHPRYDLNRPRDWRVDLSDILLLVRAAGTCEGR